MGGKCLEDVSLTKGLGLQSLDCQNLLQKNSVAQSDWLSQAGPVVGTVVNKAGSHRTSGYSTENLNYSWPLPDTPFPGGPNGQDGLQASTRPQPKLDGLFLRAKVSGRHV